MDNRAAILRGPHELTVDRVPMPAAGPGEVLIDVQAVGVCGSDTHYFTHGRVGRFVVTQPLVLGHEAAGVIREVGDGVDSVAAGDRVAIEPGVACGRCRTCRSGRYNLCPSMRFLATPPVDGALVQHLAMPATSVFRIPEAMSFEHAALVEPLCVGLWALQRSGFRAGERVLITGAGPVGLLAAEAARALGAAEVVVTDVSEARLDVARAHGHSVRTSREPVGPDGGDFDLLLECSGADGVLAEGLFRLAPGGRAVMIGIPDTDVQLALPALHDRELTVHATFRYANTWPLGISLISSGAVDVSGIVTDHFPLSRSADALLAGTKDRRTMKAVICPQQVE